MPNLVFKAIIEYEDFSLLPRSEIRYFVKSFRKYLIILLFLAYLVSFETLRYVSFVPTRPRWALSLQLVGPV